MVRQANEKHEVRSMIGRVRHLGDIVSTNRTVRDSAARMSVNSPVQGLGSDKCCAALIEMQDWIRWHGTNAPWLPNDDETSWDWLERRMGYRREIEDALREVQEKGPAIPAYMNNTIHDALLAEVQDDYTEMFNELCHAKMNRRMCQQWPKELMLATDITTTDRWHDDRLDLTKICDLGADDL